MVDKNSLAGAWVELFFTSGIVLGLCQNELTNQVKENVLAPMVSWCEAGLQVELMYYAHDAAKGALS